MGLLTATTPVVSWTMIASCYTPDLRDCTVRCTAESDCAAGQVCGSDRFCAAPEIAGTCRTLPGDAGAVGRDAGAADAKLVDAAPDAATTAELLIKIDGKGRTTLSSGGACDEMAPDRQCAFTLELGLAISIDATPGDDFMFDRWTAGPCIGGTSTACAFIFTAPTFVGARFRK